MSDLKHPPWRTATGVLHHGGVFRRVDVFRTDARHGFAVGPARARLFLWATLAEWELLHTFDAAVPLVTAAMCSPLAPVGVAAIVRIERRATTVAVDIRPAHPRWRLRRRRASIASFEVGHLTTV